MMERIKALLPGHKSEDAVHTTGSLEERELRVEMAVAAVDAFMVCAEEVQRRLDQVHRSRDGD
jgi:hypothetical protein